MKDKKTFGAFIREKRINKNYSQKDLAEMLFVTESAVSKWERGITYPDITLITDICRILDVSEKELIQSSDDNEYRKIKSDSDKYNKIKKVLFWTLNICYITGIITCFIVNLAVNHTLSWFFIVVASILVSYCFCPTIIWVYHKYKKIIFIGSTFISLFLLFLVVSVYNNNYWFMIPTMGVLLGYFIIFYPILFIEQKKYLSIDKYKNISKWFLFSYSIGILVIILLLLVSIYCYCKFNLLLGFIITLGCMLLPIILGLLFVFQISDVGIKIFISSVVGLLVLFLFLGLGRSIYIKSLEKMKDIEIEEVFDNININVKTEDVNIHLSKDNKTKAIYKESEKMLLDVKVESQTLIINRVDNRKFYDKLFNFGFYTLDLYLSPEIINSLNIECSTADINIYEGFTFNYVDIENSTGNIKLNSNVKKDLIIENSTGDIKLTNSFNTGNIWIKTNTGRIDLSNVNCKKLDINCSSGDTKLSNVLVKEDFNMNGRTGDLYLDDFDAANIYVKLSTGDVKGTIITSKFFVAKSDTGIVNVPLTREGGECFITVDTGDIIIKLS